MTYNVLISYQRSNILNITFVCKLVLFVHLFFFLNKRLRLPQAWIETPREKAMCKCYIFFWKMYFFFINKFLLVSEKLFLNFFNSKKSYGDRFPCPIDRSILIRNEVSEIRFCWLKHLWHGFKHAYWISETLDQTFGSQICASAAVCKKRCFKQRKVSFPLLLSFLVCFLLDNSQKLLLRLFIKREINLAPLDDIMLILVGVV